MEAVKIMYVNVTKDGMVHHVILKKEIKMDAQIIVIILMVKREVFVSKINVTATKIFKDQLANL
jgi:cysteine sulfinate desulfinase/cysteine desulfurase-like protein